jgi:hypothetical protein
MAEKHFILTNDLSGSNVRRSVGGKEKGARVKNDPDSFFITSIIIPAADCSN